MTDQGFDGIADALYALHPDAFAAARDDAVKQARAAGVAPLARELAKLRRPTLSAWMVNLLWRDQATVLEQLFRLAKMYGRQGWAATRFFWSILGKTFWHSPRSLPQMINLLGMYQHFCKLLAQDVAWDPWAPATAEPQTYSSRVSVSDGLSRVGQDEGAVDGRATLRAIAPRNPKRGDQPSTRFAFAFV